MKESRDTRKVISRLQREGWIMRQGKGDHINFFMPESSQIITIDSGKKEIDKNIYKKIRKIAGWE